MCMFRYRFALLWYFYFVSEENELTKDGKSLEILSEGPEEISY